MVRWFFPRSCSSLNNVRQNAAFASKPPLAPAPVSIERAEHAPRTIKRPRDYRTAEDDNVDHLRKRVYNLTVSNSISMDD